MSFKQIVIRTIANIVFLIKKEEIKNANLKFLIFTGTSGKTTMKDVVYATLQGLHVPATRSIYGYNNELGILLTILDIQDFSMKAPSDWLRLMKKIVINNRFICIELGADFYTDTDWFLKKFSPYAVFISSSDSSSWSRNISVVELDRRKLFKATSSEGFIAYNYDDSTIQKLVEESNSKAMLLSFSVSRDSSASVFLEYWENPFEVYPVNEAALMSDSLTVNILGAKYNVRISKPIFEPQVYGVLAAYLCVYFISNEHIEKVGEVISNYQFSENRLQVFRAKNGAIIIEDSYKATPLCTAWYLNLSSKLHATTKILIMTEMRPLTFTVSSHYKELARQTQFADKIFFIGPHRLFTLLYKNNNRIKETFVDEYKDLSKDLLSTTEPGDVILLKGSRRYNLEYLRSMLV